MYIAAASRFGQTATLPFFGFSLLFQITRKTAGCSHRNQPASPSWGQIALSGKPGWKHLPHGAAADPRYRVASLCFQFIFHRMDFPSRPILPIWSKWDEIKAERLRPAKVTARPRTNSSRPIFYNLSRESTRARLRSYIIALKSKSFLHEVWKRLLDTLLYITRYTKSSFYCYFLSGNFFTFSIKFIRLAISLYFLSSLCEHVCWEALSRWQPKYFLSGQHRTTVATLIH